MADNVDYRLQLMLEAQDNMSSKIVEVQKRVEELKKQVNSTSDSVKNAGNSASSILSGLKGTIAKLGLTAMAVKAGKSIIELADNLEKSKIAFETMLGSAEKAEIMLKQLSEFAMKTPFELTGIRSSAQQLLAMGVQAEEMIPTLKALGDVSAGLSVPLERLALNYGQVIAQGKLTGKELRDFTTAGVPLLDELSSMLGKSTTEIQNMISAGKISSDIMVQAFQNMTSEGGKFADLMGKQATTLSGMRSNFEDTLAGIGEQIGTALLPAIKGYVEQIGQWTEDNAELIQEIAGEVFDTIKTVIDNIIESVGEVRTVVSDFIAQVGEGFGMLMEMISGDNDETTTGIKNDWSDVFYYLKVGFTSIVQVAKVVLTAISSYFIALVNTVGDVGGNIGNIFSALWSDIKNGALNMASGCVNAIVKLVNGAIDKINRMSEQLSKIPGVNISALEHVGDVDFGGAETGKISEALKNLGSSISDNFSKATEQTTNAFNSGMDSLLNVYQNRIEDITKQATGGIENSSKTIGSSLGNMMGNDNETTSGGGSSSGKSSKNTELEALKKEMQEYAKETERLKKQKQEYYKSLDNYAKERLKNQKGVIDDVNKEYQEKFDEIQKKIDETEKTIESLNNAISSLKSQMAGLQIDERKSIAKEVVNARKELKALEEQYEGLADVANSVSREDLQGIGGVGKFDVDLIKKYKDYQDELNSMYDGMSTSEQQALNKEIEYAERYDSLNGIEKIKEDYRIRQEEIQNELNSKLASLEQEQATLRQYKREQNKLQDERIKRIDEEVKKYQEMYDKVKAFEEKYMEQLQTDHFKQISMTNQLIDQWNAVYRAKLRAMSAGSDGSRASGGPVYQGNSYLVGETGPELFVPSSNGRIVKNSDLENGGGEISINLNMGGVVINNGEDEEAFARKVISEIQRGLQLSKKGINIYNI